MTTDSIKELATLIRLNADMRLWPAADALEALAGDRDRTRADYETMKAHNKELFGKLSAAEAERDRLKAALQPFSDAYERLVRTQESMGFGDNATFGLGIKVSAIKAARKALGGDE